MLPSYLLVSATGLLDSSSPGLILAGRAAFWHLPLRQFMTWESPRIWTKRRSGLRGDLRTDVAPLCAAVFAVHRDGERCSRAGIWNEITGRGFTSDVRMRTSPWGLPVQESGRHGQLVSETRPPRFWPRCR
jgi:hypothetical protein